MSRFDHILHRADGVTTVELNTQVDTFRAVTSEKLTAVRQDVWSAELTLVTSEAFIVNVGDWIEAKGMRLYCMSTIDRYTCSEDNNREYQLTFYDPIYYLRQAVFYNTSESVSEGVYYYSRVDNAYPSVGTFEDFVKLCCYNCNSVQGVRMFKVGTVSESILTDIRVLTFSDYNCLAVLKQTCEEFETTWRVRINEGTDSLFIIDFGVEIEDFPVTLQVEKSQGLMSIEVTASDRDVFTQFVVKGGTDNLPSDYPHTNLQLDEDLEGTPPVYANSIIKLPHLYARWGKSVKELIFEDINPRRTGTVTGINEDILKFTDSDLIGAEWSPAGGTIHFVSGHLIGFTFNCNAFDPETGLITIESAQENNGFILPSETDSYYRIGIGDKYNVAGVSLPASYVSAAKTELKERALLVINGYWSQQRIESIIKIDPSIISVDIVPNMGFHIIHNALGINKIIMAKQVVYDLSLNYPYDIESITVSDWATDDSRADTLHRRVALAQILAKKKQQKGDQGVPGPAGEDGQPTYTWIKYADVADGTGLYDTPTSNTLYIGIAVNKTTPTESTTKTDYTWSKFKGDQGVAGADGVTTYTWIKYASDSSGTGITDDPTGMTYIGFAYNKTTAVESTTPGDYTWSLIKGEQGLQGIQGTPGSDGITYYTWVRYADTPTTGMSQYPTGKSYIGFAYNKTTATESSNYADYKWSLIKGEQGIPGDRGADGTQYYTWIKYADTPTSGMSDSPTGKAYIGIAVNKTTATESTNYADYTWQLTKGEKGDAGVSITGVDVEFAKNTNPTTAPTTGWTTTAPSITGTEQLWTRTKTTYSSGNPTYSTPANITPKKGDTGAVGQGIESVTEEYAISTSKTTQPTTGWSTTQPTWVQGQYIWSRVKVVYKNPAQTIYTGYAVSSEWEAVNALEIGGRNLLILNPIFWQRGGISSATGVVGSSTTRLANITGNEIGGVVPYVVEFYSPHNIFLFFYDENDNYLGFNGWLTERTFGVTPAGTKKVKFTVAKSDNSTIVVDDILDVKIKLEKGNKPTDWTPAPEDKEYIYDSFADGNTYVAGGLVLSSFIGVLDGTDAVVAGMAGKDFVLDGETPITSPMLFAGATTAQNANNAKFRVYQDGGLYAELGKIGGLTIAADKLYLGVGNYANADTPFYVEGTEAYKRFSLGNKFSFDGTDLTINGGGTFTGQISVGGVLIGKDAFGSGLHGIKLNDYNYWYLDGANAKVKFGGETNYISWDGTTLKQNGAAIGGGSIVGTSIDIPNATTPLFKVTAAGVVTAKSGTIGGLTIASTKTYLGAGTYGNADTPFYVDTSNRFSLGNKLTLSSAGVLSINGGGTFSGALSAASGNFIGLVDAGGIKVGAGAVGVGVDGLYINANNYWDELGNFKAGGSSSYLYWNGTTFSVKGDITGSTGTFSGVFAGSVEAGDAIFGVAAGGVGNDGLYINANNYWYDTGVFKVGSSTKYLYFDGTNATFAGALSAASGTFTGTVAIGETLKIGASVNGANNGLFINSNNYWYGSGALKIGGTGAYLLYESGALSMVGGSISAGSFTTTDGTTSVDISPTAVSGAGVRVSKGDAFAQIGLSGSWPSVFIRQGGTGTPSALLTPGQVTVGDTMSAVLQKNHLSLSGLVFNTTNLGTGDVVKTSGGGFLRFGTTVDNEDGSHKHNKISGYTVSVVSALPGTPSASTIYFVTGS